MNQSESSNPQAQGPRATRSTVPTLSAVAAATLVFLAFVAYGKLSPATYLATAQIVLKPTGAKPVTLRGAGNPAEQLREAAFDAESLEQMAHELGLGSGPGAQHAASLALRDKVTVNAASPGVFEVSVRASTAPSTQRICNLLARHAASQVLRLFGEPVVDDSATKEAARAKSAAELAKLMAAHPELTPPPVVAPVSAKDPIETEIPALRAERNQLQARLDRLTGPSASSDNPFGDQGVNAPEITRMRRRLAEIEQKLSGRKRSDKKSDAPKIAPDVEHEWKRLLREVADPAVLPRAPAEVSFAVLLREATLPTAPVKPNRRLVAIVGALASILSGLAIGVWQSGRLRRRMARDAELNARMTSDAPPRPYSEPPRPSSDPPRAGSERPRPGSNPPRPRSDPPRPGSDPPHQRSDRPALGSDPPRPPSNPPQPGSDPPRPLAGEARRASTDPPRRGSDPIPAHAIATVSAELTAGRTLPLSPPNQPNQPDQENRAPVAAANIRVPKGTQIGLGVLDPRAIVPKAVDPLERTAVADPEPFHPSPSARGNASSTLRPPPPEEPGKALALPEPTRLATDEGSDAELLGLGRQPPTPEPGETDDTWTGPSRAHRRSVSARRTTQVMGSPIAPVRRGQSVSPDEGSRGSQRPTPRPSPSPTSYSYVSGRPEEQAPGRAPATPPYYYQPGSAEPSNRARKEQPATPRPPTMSQSEPPDRARVTVQPVRQGWAPDPLLDLRLRRQLSDQIFPLAVERCFVLGIVAVPAARSQKSRVAAELALALAEPQHPRVLLLEADFQWPAVHQIMRVEMPMSRGLSQQLRSRIQTPREPWTVMGCGPSLHVLGESVMRSPGLILTAQFEDGLRSLRTHYDVIVVDGPDTSAEVECRALGTLIDGVICVAPATGSPDLERAAAAFPEVRFSAAVGV